MRLVQDAVSSNPPAAHDIGVIGTAIALNGLNVALPVAPEVPAVMMALANAKAEAVVIHELFRMCRRRVLR